MKAPAGARHSAWTGLVDHAESYGPEVMAEFLRLCGGAGQGRVLDLGAGQGRDLSLARRIWPQARLCAVECHPDNLATLASAGIETFPLDLETSALPFADESCDIIIANQILEHTKEIFWIVHEAARTLKTGGHFIVGLPNVAALHNRLGLLFGLHPTQAKACSAHVRVFSRRDWLLFLEEGFPGGFGLSAFAGANFYPFPGRIARLFARLAPNCAFSIFFLLRKLRAYEGTFAKYPATAGLETNFRAAAAGPPA